MGKTFRKYIIWHLVVSVLLLGFISGANAGLAPSTPMAAYSWDRDGDLDRIQEILEVKMISQRLDKLGFSEEEIQSRLTCMSDRQIHQLALKLDELKVGGDGCLFIVGILVIVILVWVIVYLYGGHKIVVK